MLGVDDFYVKNFFMMKGAGNTTLISLVPKGNEKKYSLVDAYFRPQDWCIYLFQSSSN